MGFLTIFYKYIIQQYFTVTAPHSVFSQYLKKNYAGSYTPRSILGAVAVSRQPIRGGVR